MTGRERIRAAFAGQSTDRLPYYEQAIASDVASAILGRPASTGATLLHYEEAAAWMRGDQAHAEWEAGLFDDLIAITRALDMDMVSLPWRRIDRPTAQVGEYDFVYGDPDGDHEVWRHNPTAKTFYRAAVRRAVPPPSDPDELEPTVRWWADYAARATTPEIAPDHEVLRLRAACPDLETPCGVGLSIPLDELWLSACALRPDLVARYLDALVEVNLRHLEAWAAQGFWLVWGGGDLADNRGPCYGPKVFRELVAPRVRRMCDGLHALGMKYVYRTDGNLWSIADEFFVATGADGYGEIDHDAGMSIPAVRGRYPQITCWGDVPCGSLLHRGTPAQVREFVQRRLDWWDGRGGWILGSSNTLVPGTPAANVMAMVEAGREG